MIEQSQVDRSRKAKPGPGAASWRTRIRGLLRGIVPTRAADHEAGLDDLGREQGQVKVRLLNGLVALTYLVLIHYPVNLRDGVPNWFAFLVAFIGFSVLLLVLGRYARKSSLLRRLIGNVGDVCAISYVMIATGTAGIPLFILYLSTTLGNGFRFGVWAMRASAALSLVGFAGVVFLSPEWRNLPLTVPIGVFLALMLLPAYTSHLIRQLASATRRAEEASAAKSRFIARMSHELRTPLTGILGTTELLEANKRLTREDRSLLQVIKESVKVSMRQIDNVLDFSKIEAGKLAVEQIDFDLHEVLNRAARLVRPVALEKGLRLVLRIDPAMPYELVGDPHHLNEILLNLLSNGIKFTEAGYVSLEARLVEAEQNSALIRFEVHDTGIGMDEDAAAHIFDAFSQADTSTTRRHGGTGLGTTIAKQLVELMGGRLQVRSAKGQGTVFVADVRFARQPLHDGRGDAVVGGLLGGVRLLLISKDRALGNRLSAAVREWGVSVSAQADVAEVPRLLARGIRLGSPLQLVLVDAGLAVDAGAAHALGDVLEKAALSATPVFLVGDVPAEEATLRAQGYAGALSGDLPSQLIFNVLHASFASEAMEDRAVVQVEPWAWSHPGRFRPRVLVADDNRTNLMILRKILERARYEVDTADNGNQALEMLQRHRYKVAVLDMHMPGRDGVEVMREYRFSRHGARTPVIMLTANATIDAKVESADAGADAYLTKPATASDVLSTIKKVLDDSQVHQFPVNAGTGVSQAVDVPLLNTEVIADLDRLYGDPGDMKSLLDTFESDSRRLLHELGTAIEAKDKARFHDLVHALKGNAANIGALRLVQLSYEVENLGVLDLYRDGRKLLEQFNGLLDQSLEAMREFMTAEGDDRQAAPGSPADPSLR